MTAIAGQVITACPVPLKHVLQLCDPRASWPWPCPAPGPGELQALLLSAPEVAQPVGADASAVDHIGRVRYLVRCGWTDPIELDVGVPCLNYPGPDWPVTDGNHRLWAATLRKDEFIAVDVAGQVDHAAMLLGVTEEAIGAGRVD